jgi:hypothetical protein
MRDLETEITCPSCQRRIKIKVKEMIPGHTKNCPSCNLVIRFSGDNGQNVQHALDDLEKALKKLGSGR